MNKIGAVVDVLATTNDQKLSGINLVLSRISTNKATMRLGPGTWEITSDLSIPANVNLKMEQGTNVTISGGKTLTILGTIEAGNYQVFDCSAGGAVVVPAGSKVDTSWFGGLANTVAGLSGTNKINARVTTSESIAADLTVPDNVTCTVQPGAIFTVTAGKYLTFPAGHMISTSWFNGLPNLIAGVAATRQLNVVVDQAETIASDCTVNANVLLSVTPGKVLAIADGKVLTLNGPCSAGDFQIFNCSAGGKVAFRVGSIVNTAWFGGLANLVAGLSGTNQIKAIMNASETISGDLTVPSYVTLQINRGPTLTIAETKVLTIKGIFEAGVYHVFIDQNTGLDGVAFGTTSVNMLYPEWWGAVGDLTNDDTSAVQAAFNAQYGIQQRSWQVRAFGGSI